MMPPKRQRRAPRSQVRKSPPRRPPVRRVGQDWRWWLVIVVVVVAVIAGVLVQQSRSETEHARVVTPRAAVGPNGGVLTGNPRARVSITEYADFQCPICRQLHQRWSTTLTKLVDQ